MSKFKLNQELFAKLIVELERHGEQVALQDTLLSGREFIQYQPGDLPEDISPVEAPLCAIDPDVWISEVSSLETVRATVGEKYLRYYAILTLNSQLGDKLYDKPYHPNPALPLFQLRTYNVTSTELQLQYFGVSSDSKSVRGEQYIQGLKKFAVEGFESIRSEICNKDMLNKISKYLSGLGKQGLPDADPLTSLGFILSSHDGVMHSWLRTFGELEGVLEEAYRIIKANRKKDNET